METANCSTTKAVRRRPDPASPLLVARKVAAGRKPDARIAYVMTDGGALPLWFSRTVAALEDVLCGTVTVGQAFGGDLEAVTVHTALLAAKHVLRADLAIVTQGPGNLGTGTPLGFSGVAAGEAPEGTASVPVIASEGRAWPVEIRYTPAAPPARKVG